MILMYSEIRIKLVPELSLGVHHMQLKRWRNQGHQQKTQIFVCGNCLEHAHLSSVSALLYEMIHNVEEDVFSTGKTFIEIFQKCYFLDVY